MRYTPRRADLTAVLDRLAGHRIAVVGDPVLDRYVLGTTSRISREAPVLIVREDEREHRLGGAANTAANFAALGAHTFLVGLIGPDEEGKTLKTTCIDQSIDTQHLIERKKGCTVTKTRIMAGGLHTVKQQMIRIDRENQTPMTTTDADALFEAAALALDHVDAVVISDYGDPAATDVYVKIAQAARVRNRIVVVDSRYALLKFKGVTAVTPNEPEVESILSCSLESDTDAINAANQLVEELDLACALITRGREGMALAQRDGPGVLLDAHGGHDAVDVTGAGDTVTAVFTLALAARTDPQIATALANCAASIVVQTMGTATCTLDMLRHLAERDLS